MGRDDELRKTTEELIAEVIRTAITFEEVFSALLPEIPDAAFPGEDKAKALFGMVVGSVEPATAAVGERDCRTAIALLGAVRERVFADLRTAAELRREREDGQ